MSSEEKRPPLSFHPKEIKGSWDRGFVLDVHTISSTMIGYNEYGHPEFDTQRSPLGEMVYRLKYRADKSVLPAIVETIVEFLANSGIQADVVVPVPPSKTRSHQPVIEIASELSNAVGIPLDSTSLTKGKATPQMKDVGDFSERVVALQDAFSVNQNFQGKLVLLIDDLFQSGATLNVVAATLKKQGGAKAVNVIVLTRTRS
jgi:predicted amidophosphoribosyltransferase